MNPRLCRCSHQQRLHTSGTGRCWSTVCGCVTFRPSDPAEDPDTFTTVAEVAALFGVSKMSIYREVHAGELRAIRVGRQIRIPLRALREYMARNEGAA